MCNSFYQNHVFLEAVNNLILKLKESSCDYIIYGSGNHTLDLLKHLTKYNLFPKAIVYDPSSDHLQNKTSFPLMKINEIKNIEFDYVITSSLSYQSSMLRKLKNLKISPKKILTLYGIEIIFCDLWTKLQKIPTFYFCYENCYDIFKLSKKIKDGNVVEIGSWAGRSTIALSFYGLINNYKVYSIDPWFKKFGNVEIVSDLKIFEEWQNNIKQFDFSENIEPMIGTSSEISKKWDNDKLIDLLLIDGIHNYKDSIYEIKKNDIRDFKIKGFKVKGKFYASNQLKKIKLPDFGVKVDYDLWSPLIKKGGYIAFHDINSKVHPAVDRVWNEEIINKPKKWAPIMERNNLGIAKKI